METTYICVELALTMLKYLNKINSICVCFYHYQMLDILTDIKCPNFHLMTLFHELLEKKYTNYYFQYYVAFLTFNEYFIMIESFRVEKMYLYSFSDNRILIIKIKLKIIFIYSSQLRLFFSLGWLYNIFSIHAF